ncbi:LytTR family DNA-binding domain-containing protein [Blautia schinkii]|nr:LytTR family DNA-binding domain-containing protein [Blautia schinkii]
MYRIIICDDEETARKEIKALVLHLMDIIGEPCLVQCVKSPEQLLKLRQKGARWDLILLDILMGGPDGLRLAEDLRRSGDETDVVFVTSCAEYALDGYRSYPVSYLLKPLTKESLRPVLGRCLSRWRQEPLLHLDTGHGGSAAVAVKDICYIEVFRRELVVHCADREVTGMGALTELAQQLTGRRFYRSHRSFLVNLEWVAGIQRYHFLLKNGARVPIAVRSYPEAQKRWLEHLS